MTHSNKLCRYTVKTKDFWRIKKAATAKKNTWPTCDQYHLFMCMENTMDICFTFTEKHCNVHMLCLFFLLLLTPPPNALLYWISFFFNFYVNEKKHVKYKYILTYGSCPEFIMARVCLCLVFLRQKHFFVVVDYNG